MAEGLLDENRNAPSAEVDESEAFSLRCGWRNWRPECLQMFASPKWFICALSLFSISQGLLVNGLTGVSIPDIEKEFGLSSSSAGIILASNDIAGIILVPVVSFWGTHGRKPKWIGLGAVITGIGALLFALPKAIIGKYSIPGTGNVNPFCAAGGNGNICTKSTYGSSSIYLFILCVGQFVMGAGTTPLYTLGPTYLDENVNPKVSPVYLGIWFATTFLGPGLGYALGGTFLKTFTDLELPAGVKLTPRDPRWVGAWWFGFFVFSWLLLFSGALILCFPKEMPKYKKKREDALKEGNLMEADTEIVKSLRGFVIATIRLLKNKTFIFAVLALTVRTLYGSAIGSFFAKIIYLKFGGTTSEIALATGAVLLPGMAVGIMLGAFVMKKLPIKDSAKYAALICTCVSVLTIGGSTAFLLPGCKTTVMAGSTTPYNNSTEIGSLNSKCNSDCACSRRLFAPVCGIDGKSYFSPCHAGCQGAISKTDFIQCRCITGAPLRRRQSSNLTNINLMAQMATKFLSGALPFPNVSSAVNFTGNQSMRSNLTLKHEAKAGFCDRECKNAKLFMLCSFLLILFVFSSATPQKMIMLRCVPENQRAYALGLQFLFMRSLSFIPGPVIFGTVIDSQCTLWSKDDCGIRGNCLDYNVDTLSLNIVYLGLTTGSIGSLFYFLAWFFYKPSATPAEKEVKIDEEDGILLKEKDQDASPENGNA